MTFLIFRRSFWTLKRNGPPTDRGILVFGGVFLIACAILFTGIIEPKWFIATSSKPMAETKANLAWDVLARRQQHEQRLCDDREKLEDAARELKMETEWTDGGGYPDGYGPDLSSSNRALDCFAKIAPLPPAPPAGGQ